MQENWSGAANATSLRMKLNIPTQDPVFVLSTQTGTIYTLWGRLSISCFTGAVQQYPPDFLSKTPYAHRNNQFYVVGQDTTEGRYTSNIHACHEQEYLYNYSRRIEKRW